jgi:hypothetical protein
MSKPNPYYAILDRNGTEVEITIYAPEGRAMLCMGFWDAEYDDDPVKHDTDQLKEDALLIVEALNAHQKRLARRKPKLTDYEMAAQKAQARLNANLRKPMSKLTVYKGNAA